MQQQKGAFYFGDTSQEKKYFQNYFKEMSEVVKVIVLNNLLEILEYFSY